ncbi:MAG: 2Fe-2S iron-sulfur cluster-binding protein, partial [Bacillota bacterium]
GAGHCGTCTVIMNGDAVTSCTIPAMKADGADILTIEGLAEGYKLHPIQEAFIEAGAIQCGFCTPGLVMRTYDLLTKNPRASEQEIMAAVGKHLCRCTGYEAILEAVRLAQEKMAAVGG